MSEEFSAGVRIVLERAKSNPEELMETYGKWQHLREAVFDYKETGKRGAWVRGLRDDEIDALYDSFCSCHRKIFDDWVMQQVLTEDNTEERQLREAQQLNNAPMLRPGGIYQMPMASTSLTSTGTWDNAINQMSNTSLGNLVHGLNQGRK
jgi:hypothetical protein